MSTEKSNASEHAMYQNQELAGRAYGIGVPLLQHQLQMAQQGLDAGGQPDYVKRAFEGQRAGIVEGTADQQKAQTAAFMQAGGKAGAGGNFSMQLTPGMMGAQLANALTSSNVSQGQAQVGEMNQLTQMSLGGGTTGASAGMAAGANQLPGIGMMANYNPLFASILGGASGAYGIYGGLRQGNPYAGNAIPTTSVPGGGSWSVS